ncbi:MAG: RNA polymerase sigma factor [Thermoanaerobaculia bacterium]
MNRERGRRPIEEELEMVARMRAGSVAAFDLFSECYLPELLRFARRRLPRDPELARDIAQATACLVIEKLDSFRGESALTTWMLACCQHEIAAYFRRFGRRPREVEFDESAPPADPAEGAEEQLLHRETASLVHATLRRMPPIQARAIRWRYLEGLAVPEIAERLESSYKATESLLSRARAAFRRAHQRLTRELVAEPPGETGSPQGSAG